MNLTVVERKTRLIGAIMVEQGLLTPAQLRAALEVQAERGGLLGEIVMAEFGVSRAQVSQIIAEQLAELEAPTESERLSAAAVPQLRAVGRLPDGETPVPVGDALLELGLVTRDQIDSAHKIQRETGERLGEILVGQGVISRLELADALSEHWSSLTKLRAPGVVDAPVEAAAPAQISGGELGALAGAVEGVGARLEASIADRDQELAGQFERLSSRLDEMAAAGQAEVLVERIASLDEAQRRGEEVLGRLVSEVAAVHERTEARLEAIAAAQEAGTTQGSAAELEALTGEFGRLSARLDELVGGRDGELVARVEGLSARFDELVGGRDELAAQFERLSERLEELVGGGNGDIVARLEGMSARFDEVAAWHERTEARLEAIAAAPEAGASQGSAAELEALTGELGRLSERLEELVGRRDELPGQFERLSARFDDVAALHERTEARLEAIAAAQKAGASQGSAAELDAHAGQVAALEASFAGRDQELVGQFERLSARFDDVAALHERTEARLEAIAAAQKAGASQGSAAELEALADVGAGLEASFAGRDRELALQFERLSVRLDELVGGRDELTGRFEVLAVRLDEIAVAGQADVLVERIASLDEAQRRGAEVLGRLVSEVAVLHEQTEAILEASTKSPATEPGLMEPLDGSRKKNKKKKKK